MIVLLAAASSATADDKTLERQLQAQAPQVIEKLRQLDCKTVGVLKFRVQKDKGQIDDNAGALNKLLADRLEAALVLANPANPQNQVRIVHDASSIAAKIAGASHLYDKGRKALFDAEYPLAWGNERVKVDYLLTGLVQLAADQKSLRVAILAVGGGASSTKLLLPPFEVATNGSILHELGESFQLRGEPGQEADDLEAASSAQRIREDPAAHFPLREQNKPAVQLLIHYDDKPVAVELRDGGAWVPEPREGQKVTLEIERLDTGTPALGVVLKVNGENTLYRERFRDIDCQKWVLIPTWRKTTIRGFQIDNNTTAEFRVASRQESRSLEVYYGADVGTISLAAFQELPPDQADLPTEDSSADATNALDATAIAQAKFPEKPADDLEGLKAQLRPLQSRGVIDRGQAIASPVRDEKYRWSPEPILSVVIRYYHPTSDAPRP
jgi:hypothetical protein